MPSPLEQEFGLGYNRTRAFRARYEQADDHADICGNCGEPEHDGDCIVSIEQLRRDLDAQNVLYYHTHN